MSYPQPTRERHDQFCRVEEWTGVRDARGRTGTHHVTYELGLHDGRILRTRISHPVDRSTYGPGSWSHILRDQLEVSEGEFWSCTLDGKLPDRGLPEAPRNSLPADLVQLLLSKVGLIENEVAKMSRREAIERLQKYWTEGQ